MNRPRRSVAIAFAGLCLPAFASCKSENVSSNVATTTIGQQCIASGNASTGDACGNSLVCSSGFCRQACTTDGDCPGGVCLSGNGVKGCRVEQKEATCTQASCNAGLVCAADGCRNPCGPSQPCEVAGDVCSAAGVCRAGASSDGGSGDEGVSDAGEAGGDAPAEVEAGDGATAGDGSTTAGCLANPQPFGTTAVGDPTAGTFVSGAGTVTAQSLVLFDGYASSGADAGADGGADAGPVNLVTAQSFGLGGGSPGPAAPVFASGTTGHGALVYGAATSPTGEIAVVYSDIANQSVGNPEQVLYAEFLDGTLAARQNVLLAPGYSLNGQPDVQWAGDRFVVGWAYDVVASNAGQVAIQVAMFGAGGNKLGGLGPVTTDDPQGLIWAGNTSQQYAGVTVGASGTSLAVAYWAASADPRASSRLMMTILDLQGNVVGSPVAVGTSPGGAYGVPAVAGTASGFVCAWVSHPDDAGAPALQATFVSPTGAVGATVTVPGAVPTVVRGASDGTGAAFALLDTSGVRFGYARGDLSAGLRTTSALTPADLDVLRDQVTITSAGGRFAVSHYSAQEARTRAVAVGCPPDAGP